MVPEVSGVPARAPAWALAAAIVALLIAIGEVVVALRHPLLMAVAIIPLVAGVGILRKRVWAAYGFAFFELVQATFGSAAVLTVSGVPKAQLVIGAILELGLVVLFLIAGRSLARTGARRGMASPWIAVSFVLTVPLFFVHAFAMPSGSMEDTILIGDRFLARTFPQVVPARGEIVVFRYPLDRRQTLVKRVIGVPGDRIRISSGVVYRNGTMLIEPYAVHKFKMRDEYRDDFPAHLRDSGLPGAGFEAARAQLEQHVANGELIVPDRDFFVLGDNRDNSLDSRYWGFLNQADIIGKPILIYDSEPSSGGPIRWGRIFKLL